MSTRPRDRARRGDVEKIAELLANTDRPPVNAVNGSLAAVSGLSRSG
jgi:hypothetical protein